MATHSSVLAWRIPGTGEPGGLPVCGVAQSRTRLMRRSSSRESLHFPGVASGKESACNAGAPGSIPGSGRSPGEGNGNPLQYSCLENLMDRGAWQATVHGVAQVGHDLATKPPLVVE